MAGSIIALLLVPLALMNPQAQPVATADAEVWTAVIEQVLRDVGGVLLIVNETIPTADLHGVRSDGVREERLLDLLRQRNNSTTKVITGVRLPPRARLVNADVVQSWEANKAPGDKLVRVSLPAFSEDGTKSLVYYSATGGFDDSRGGYMIFQKREGRWIAVDFFGVWVT